VAVAWLLAYTLRHLLQAVRLDERWRFIGFQQSEWAPAVSPTIIATRVVFWSVVLVGLLVGIAAFDATLTSEILRRLFAFLPNLIVAGLVLVAGSVIARFLARSVLIGAVNMNLQYATLLASGIRWLVLVLAVAMALDHLGIGGNIVHLAFGILFGGIVLALVLSVGLGSKELVSRSLEREVRKPADNMEPFRHL
jgi:mechanosensitive ion channel-like protein